MIDSTKCMSSADYRHTIYTYLAEIKMRIGINIPNELMKQLEPLKPEMNISQICREAITRHAEKHECAIANLDDEATKARLEKVINEERRRRSLLDVDWESFGYQDAVDWVKRAEWNDWKHWRSIQSHLERQERPAWDIRPSLNNADPEEVKDFDDRWHEFRQLIDSEDDEFFDWMYDNNVNTDRRPAECEYGRAWLAYVRAAWERIRQAHDEHFAAVRADRLRQCYARPEPEVPEHILEDIQRGR